MTINKREPYATKLLKKIPLIALYYSVPSSSFTRSTINLVPQFSIFPTTNVKKNCFNLWLSSDPDKSSSDNDIWGSIGSLPPLVSSSDGLDINLLETSTNRERRQRMDRGILALVSSIGLSVKESSHFLRENPELLTLDNMLSKIRYFQTEIGLTNDQLRKMILEHPSLFSSIFLENEDNLKTTQDILKETLNFTPEEWEHTLRSHPQTIQYCRSDLRRKLNFYRHQLGLSNEEVKSCLIAHPRLLLSSMESLSKSLDLLLNDLKFSVDEVRRLVVRCPNFLSYDFDNYLRPAVEFLTSELGVHHNDDNDVDLRRVHDDVKMVFLQSPHLLGFANRLNSTVQFIRDEIVGCSDDIDAADNIAVKDNQHTHLHQIVVNFPEAMGYSIERNLRPKVEYFIQSFELENIEDRRIFFTNNPRILSLSLRNNIMPKVDYFRTNLGFSKSELKQLAFKSPTTLNLSLDRNLKPKITFLLNRMGLSRDELKAFVLGQSDQLDHLEIHNMRRIKILKNEGISLTEAPPSIISGSDKLFKQWIESHRNV